MHVLITNDDGVNAPGILALAQALRQIADVSVVAPQIDQNNAGHRLTFHKPLRVRKVEMADGSPALAVNGSPADCVALARIGLIEDQIDLVLSGINTSWNLGQDITNSGTVTAAVEAVLHSLPAIAVSAQADDGNIHYSVAAAFITQLAQSVAQNGLPRHTLLNVNIPDIPQEQLAGIKVTQQGTRIYHNELIEREDPRGRPYYWIGGERPTAVPDEEGTDVWALSQGYISVTPVHLDMTAHTFMDELKGWQFDLGTPSPD